MTNRTKIVIAILVIIAIVVTIIGVVNNKKIQDNANKNQDELSNIMEYFNDDENKENKNTENRVNELEENTLSEEQTNNQTNIIGKEEQESNKENTELQDKQKAINLAKKEWGISVDSYDFQAELKSDKIYQVTVISNDSNRTAVAIYNVNVETETVTE